MTLREELFRTATNVAEKKAAERHRQFVEKHLACLCRQAADAGEFKATVSLSTVEDGKITDEDIRVFARDNDLDYTPREGLDLPILSFDDRSK